MAAVLPFSEAAAGEEIKVKRKSTMIVSKIMYFIENLLKIGIGLGCSTVEDKSSMYFTETHKLIVRYFNKRDFFVKDNL